MAVMSKSRVFLFLLLSFIIGVFCASFFRVPSWVLGGIFVFGIFLISVFWRKNPAMLAGFLILVFALGLWRCQASAQKEESIGIRRYNNQGRFLIRGEIIGEPDRRDFNQRFVLGAREIGINGDWRPAAGKILVTSRRFPEYQYGDRLEISGKLQAPENFEDFDYISYLAKDDIYSIMKYPEIEKIGGGEFSVFGVLFGIKQKFEATLGLILPEPHSSFLAALILGARKTLPSQLTENLSITGTTHIVALSGFNITIISSFIISLLMMFLIRRGAAFWISVLGIVAFTLMTGAAASVVRAAIMGIMILWAQRESRLYSITNAVVLAGALMVFVNPKILRWDIGFQLSFMATLGLIYISPIFQRWLAPKTVGRPTVLFGRKTLEKFKEVFYLTLSAQIATLPLIVYHFNRLSLAALPANLAILLVIPLTMFFGFLAGGLGLVSVFLGKIAASAVFILLSYEMAVINLFARIPPASVSLPSFPILLVAFIYLGLILAVVKCREKRQSM
jgi:competence protein ComEC